MGWEEENARQVLYVVRLDGTEVLALGSAASEPAWSADGSRIAFFRAEDGGLALYVLNVDGTDKRTLLALEQDQKWHYIYSSWSPDGSALLFTIVRGYGEFGSGRVVSVQDGSIVSDFDGIVAEWSPDGSRIAVVTTFASGGIQDVLYTMARDGTEKQVLVRGSAEEFFPGADWYDVSEDIAACAELHTGNPGLVEDCRTLLTIRNALAGDSFLNWSADVPIEEWEGVSVAGEPLRVVELAFTGGDDGGVRLEDKHKLKGVIPPELGNLSELRVLDLGIKKLTGSIPPELGNLSKLETLNLQHNLLSGSIPPELGNLSDLRLLVIQGNDFNGCVPKALSETVTHFYSDVEYCE